MKKIVLALIIAATLISCAPPVEVIKSERIIDHNLDNTVIEIEPFPEEEKGMGWTTNSVGAYSMSDGDIKSYNKPTPVYTSFETDINRSYLFYKGNELHYRYGTSELKVLSQRSTYYTSYSYHGWDFLHWYPHSPVRHYTYYATLENPPVAGAKPLNFTESLGYIAPVVLVDQYNDAGVMKKLYRMWYTEYSREYSDDPTTLYHAYNEVYKTRYVESRDGGVTWGVAASSNSLEGLTATDSLQDQGGIIVSDVKKIGENYFMWYLGKDRLGQESQTWRMFLAIYDEELQRWERQSGGSLNLVKDVNPDGFDSINVGRGSAIFDIASSKYKLWYSGNNGKVNRIGYTESRNLIYWNAENTEIYKGKAGKFDFNEVADPYVVKEGNIYRMWYSGYNELDKKWKLGLAYSWDGKYFEYYDTVNYLPLEITDYAAYDIRYPFVVFDEGKYKIWFCVRDENSTVNAEKIWRIAYIESTPPAAPVTP